MLNNLKRLELRGVYKKFNIGFIKKDSALSRFLVFFNTKSKKKIISVLEDISFSAYSGENIGIIGDNGSGKSTLLRIIADIYQADKGEIYKDGEVVYINGFGLGFKPRLTMKENVYLISSLMGLSKKEIDNKFADIVDFSGLEDFVDTKVYQFSSGMLSRLRFSATIYSLNKKNPDILLLDEVFSTGGDVDFRNKALQKIEEFLLGGSLVILVSHQLHTISKYCDKVILLKQGRIEKIGDAKEVTDYYLNSK